jgi:osmotically-inducible protein OsmY
MTNDMQIQQEVLSELDHDADVPTGAIGVEVHHGVVKLAGRVNDATTMKRVQLAARRVAGVTTVILDMGRDRR